MFKKLIVGVDGRDGGADALARMPADHWTEIGPIGGMDDAAAHLDALEAAGVEVVEHSGVSLYFRDPDGARIELIADPLGEMYGQHVL